MLPETVSSAGLVCQADETVGGNDIAGPHRGVVHIAPNDPVVGVGHGADHVECLGFDDAFVHVIAG